MDRRKMILLSFDLLLPVGCIDALKFRILYSSFPRANENSGSLFVLSIRLNFKKKSYFTAILLLTNSRHHKLDSG